MHDSSKYNKLIKHIPLREIQVDLLYAVFNHGLFREMKVGQ
jgi:hypothetical protein